MSSPINWQSIRRDFPITERTAYLDSAAAGPLSRPVMEAATEFYTQMMEGADARWDEWLERRENIRASIAAFINADPDEIAFTTNTSSGMNLIVDALIERGEVISCDLEFPVTTITWLHRGARVHMAKPVDGEVSIDALEHAMNDKTKIISLSHVQYSNGLRTDLESLGHRKNGHTLVVNASQAAGAFAIDVKRMQIDALCSTGHKWMLAGYGSGLVYLSRKLLDESRPRAIGWLSVEDPFRDRNREFEVRSDAAARSEMGCPHFAGIFALGQSVEYLNGIGRQNVEERVLTLNRYLTKRLTEAGRRVLSPLHEDRMRSGETLVADEHPKELVAHLARRGVAVTEKPQGIRVSTHFFNNEEDIERLVLGLREV